MTWLCKYAKLAQKRHFGSPHAPNLSGGMCRETWLFFIGRGGGKQKTRRQTRSEFPLSSSLPLKIKPSREIWPLSWFFFEKNKGLTITKFLYLFFSQSSSSGDGNSKPIYCLAYTYLCWAFLAELPPEYKKSDVPETIVPEINEENLNTRNAHSPQNPQPNQISTSTIEPRTTKLSMNPLGSVMEEATQQDTTSHGQTQGKTFADLS